MFSKGVSLGWNLDSRGGDLGVERKKISRLAIARHDPLPLQHTFNFYPASHYTWFVLLTHYSLVLHKWQFVSLAECQCRQLRTLWQIQCICQQNRSCWSEKLWNVWWNKWVSVLDLFAGSSVRRVAQKTINLLRNYSLRHERMKIFVVS